MRKKAPKRARAKQKRLPPDDRRKECVAKATEFFSKEGFGGGTRDLARRLGVTQPLLYRYFPSKDDLIKEVYRTVYLEAGARGQRADDQRRAGVFLAGYKRVFGAAVGLKPAPVKAVG